MGRVPVWLKPLVRSCQGEAILRVGTVVACRREKCYHSGFEGFYFEECRQAVF